MNVDVKISNAIKKLGISPSLKGYYAIREAVKLVINDFSYIGKMTTKLYPDVSKLFGTRANRVERDIRHAIESGWRNGSVEFQCEIFDYGVFESPCPTNSEFILTVADYIKLQMEEENENKKDS